MFDSKVDTEGLSKDDLIYMAKLTEQAERYDDMVEYMKALVKLGGGISVDERNFLSVAFKNKVGALRASWRVVSSVEHKESARGNEHQVEMVKKFCSKIETELRKVCDDVLQTVDELLPKANDVESKVFYYKMKGDYNRYLAEFLTGDDRKEIANRALDAYNEAATVAENLKPIDTIRLGLALNFSVFYYEIMDDSDKARNLAKTAFDDALKLLDDTKMSEESYTDSTLIMQLLRDNLSLWSSENEGEDKQEAAKAPEGEAAGAEASAAPTESKPEGQKQEEKAE